MLSRETSPAQHSLSGSALEGKAGSLPRKETRPMPRCKFCKETIKKTFYLTCFCHLQLLAIGGSCAVQKSLFWSVPDFALFSLLTPDIASRFLNTVLNLRTPVAREAQAQHQSPLWGQAQGSRAGGVPSPSPYDHPQLRSLVPSRGQ